MRISFHNNVALLIPVLLMSGCETMSNTDRGLLTGAAVGTGAGAALGSLTGHTGAGAAIGGLTGTLIGGLSGSAADEREKERNARITAAQAAQLGLIDVVQMTQQHTPDDIIIRQIRVTGSIFRLSTNDIAYLRSNSVSDVVVREMQDTAYRYPRHYYSPAPVYVVEPAPVAIGFGFGCGRRCRW